MKFGKKRVSACLQNVMNENHAKCARVGSSATSKKMIIFYMLSFNALHAACLFLHSLKTQSIFMTSDLLMFSEGIERNQWYEMC